ncbi:prephenate dehydratase [Streptococcus caprae]|uniref:Prephenate dehydratase n=1 Tax=Streptococcus caprae TaxID=1640501 RepID=A0ABV8CWI3_9STRE
MKVGYLGPSSSFTHNVAVKGFPTAELVPYETISAVIRSFEDGDVDYAVVPVENSIEGSVHETTDYLFHQANLRAVAEIVQPIKQQLMASRPHEKIEKIFSHPQAIAQGKKYITDHYPQAQIEVTASTAFAARFVAEHGDLPYAAIAPQAAAEEYGLSIIAQDIQEIDENYTRFWVLGETGQEFALPLTAKKMSLALTLPDNMPGALYKALSVFSWRGIDLTKIESRPLKTVLGEYFFMLDVDNSNAELVRFALDELQAIGIGYKILGDYQVYQI